MHFEWWESLTFPLKYCGKSDKIYFTQIDRKLLEVKLSTGGIFRKKLTFSGLISIYLLYKLYVLPEFYFRSKFSKFFEIKIIIFFCLIIVKNVRLFLKIKVAN